MFFFILLSIFLKRNVGTLFSILGDSFLVNKMNASHSHSQNVSHKYFEMANVCEIYLIMDYVIMQWKQATTQNSVIRNIGIWLGADPQGSESLGHSMSFPLLVLGSRQITHPLCFSFLIYKMGQRWYLFNKVIVNI